ncbi:class I SAM-dependent methyltransferase [Ferrimonas balearica]|uniref:class I SAM-dependent methyltransferase n=1 Tax=Ferrimonas balearica TaxID=44012 RepID=UPI001C98F9C6|nr:methyltransferase domain-containing protein [Ferrimonas balearica]MBY5993550.1 methyltransferase domain-containing protein [Ferrimonas balearica]
MHTNPHPSALLAQAQPHLPRGEAVLDLACGRGRNGLALARVGHPVWFADRDAEALAQVQQTLTQERLSGVIWQRDLEAQRRPLGSRRFGAILVFNYLHRPLLPQLVDALAPGGVLVYETFTLANRQFGRPNNPDFLLQPTELQQAFASLEHIHYREGVESDPRRAIAQLIARKPQ